MNDVLGTWVDGVAGGGVPVDDRGLQYGDGLFETMFVRDGRVRFLEAHLARLALGCARLGIPFKVADTLRGELNAAAASAPMSGILKLVVTRGSGRRRGYAPSESARPRRIVTLFAAPAMGALSHQGAHLRIATHTLAVNPALAGMKHLNRLDNVLAASESDDEEIFDSLMFDTAGHLVGGTMTNLFIVHASTLATPFVDRCGVAGVMRGVVLRECGALGLTAREARLTRGELFAGDEVFLTNARIGVVPVRRVGEHSFRMTAVAQRLRTHIEALDA
jgi:4-amino-4-deoxychorismate lyase